MITFKQFMESRDGAEALIYRDCADFMQKSKHNGLLYRGIKGLESATPHEIDGMEYTIKSVRKDRKPLDTKLSVHELVSEHFKEKFGWNPRSEAVFAFGEEVQIQDVRGYGTPCIIFPIGPIKYVWSKNVGDLYSDINTENPEHIARFFRDADYQDTELDQAVTRDHEIMIQCDKYYAFPIEYKAQLKTILGIP